MRWSESMRILLQLKRPVESLYQALRSYLAKPFLSLNLSVEISVSSDTLFGESITYSTGPINLYLTVSEIDRRPQSLWAGILMSVLPTTAVGFRLWVRRMKKVQFAADDYTFIAALVQANHGISEDRC